MEAGLPIKVLLPFVIATLMFGIGMSLTLANFARLTKTPGAAGIGMLNIFVLFPSLAFLFAWIFELPATLAVGLVLLAACPSGSTSNLFTYLARGDVALSITLTAISKTLPVITIPLYVGIASVMLAGEERSLSLSFASISERMITMVLLPTIAGMSLRHLREEWATRIRHHVTRIGVVLLLILIVLLIWRERDKLPGMFISVGPAAIVLCISGMAVAYFTAILFRLEEIQRTTVILEVCIQSGGTAIAIAAAVLSTPAMAVPAAVYSVVMYIAATLFILIKRYRNSNLRSNDDSILENES